MVDILATIRYHSEPICVDRVHDPICSDHSHGWR